MMPASPKLFFASLVALVAFGAGCAADPVEDDESSGAAIVGNQIANGERPEVVHLSIVEGEKRASCTGTVVGRRTVLTARHCLEGAIGRDGGCTGEASVDLFGRGKSAGAKYAFERCSNPRLGIASFTNDFGLIRLAKPVVGVTPAKLAREKPSGDRFTTFGYGMHGDALLLGSCELESDGNKRKLAYRGRIGIHFGVQTCPGDSGGPHFVDRSNVIAGITSGGMLFVDSTAATFAYAEELAAQIAAFEL